MGKHEFFILLGTYLGQTFIYLFTLCCIDVYAYPSENIVVMTDSSQTSSGRVPNRKNILYEISQLVDDARPGDHFFFHYSGHAAQAENRNNSEEDGMDEYLIPVDGESLMIKDNELRTRLVDSLPVGSHLFVRYISVIEYICRLRLSRLSLTLVIRHLYWVGSSSRMVPTELRTILDLEHHRCNRVYVPWMSKGRRKSDSMWN
ncbi:caspase domain-containing protein, partial [Flagelloscypha sp. PMI_526]